VLCTNSVLAREVVLERYQVLIALFDELEYPPGQLVHLNLRLTITQVHYLNRSLALAVRMST
jgi:hypothetical protein